MFPNPTVTLQSVRRCKCRLPDAQGGGPSTSIFLSVPGFVWNPFEKCCHHRMSSAKNDAVSIGQWFPRASKGFTHPEWLESNLFFLNEKWEKKKRETRQKRKNSYRFVYPSSYTKKRSCYLISFLPNSFRTHNNKNHANIHMLFWFIIIHLWSWETTLYHMLCKKKPQHFVH